MVILSYNIPYHVLLTAGGGLLVLIAVALMIQKRRRHKRKQKAVNISNAEFAPTLPISNIIKDKIRKPLPYNTKAAAKRNKVVLRLTELHSETVYHVKLKKNITIGRKRRCNIRIKDVTVAPVHCIISFNNGQAYVEDNNTLNGTILNGILIRNKIPIFTNDLILIGNKEYKIEVLF